MNKIVFFIVCFTTLSLYSQKEDTIITINPFGINKYPKKKYRYGNTVKFEITNVNVFKLNGGVEGKGETPVFEIPKVFKELDSISENTEDKINEDDIKKTTDSLQLLYDSLSLKSVKNGAEADLTLKQLVKKLKSELKELNEQLNKLKTLTNSKDNFIEHKQKFISNLYKINSYLSFKDRINSELKDSVFIRDLVALKGNIDRYYSSTFDDYITDDIMEVKNTITGLLQNYSVMKLNYDIINKTLEDESFKLKGDLKISDGKTVFKVEEAELSVKRKKLFEKEMAYANKLRDSLAKPETQKMIVDKTLDGLSLYHKIKSDTTFSVYTNSYQLLDDIVTLTPKLKDAKGNVVHSFEPLQLKTRYKWKVNFSSGYFLSFIGDENYSYQKDSLKIAGVKKIETDKVTHALGGMLHAYANYWDGFQPALSAGLSVNSNGTLGFYGGLSFLFTEKNRMVFSLGYSLTSVKVLDRGNLDDDNSFINTNDLEIRYNDVYKGAFFIGVTYNLSETEKK